VSTEPLERADLTALPIFPLPDAALFPGATLPLHVFESRYRDLARDTLRGRGTLAIARLQPGFERDYDGRPPVFEICGAGRIVDHRLRPDGRYDLVLHGLARIRIVEELAPLRPYRQVRAIALEDSPSDPALSAALKTTIANLWHALSPHLPVPMQNLQRLTVGADDAGTFADRLAPLIADDPETTQQLLTQLDPIERLQLIATRLQILCDKLGPAFKRSKTELN
jgi:uncharacterized protein